MIENLFKNLNDIELINLFQERKSDDIFEEIYIRYKDMIYNYVQRFLYNQPKDIVYELIDDIFIKVYLQLFKLKDSNAFKSWLFRIARNISINYIRNNKFPFISLDNQKTLATTENIVDPRIDIETDYINTEIRQAAFKEINKQNDKIREIIILKFFNKLTNHEISDITSLSVKTINNKINKVFEKIKNRLKKTGYI